MKNSLRFFSIVVTVLLVSPSTMFGVRGEKKQPLPPAPRTKEVQDQPSASTTPPQDTQAFLEVISASPTTIATDVPQAPITTVSEQQQAPAPTQPSPPIEAPPASVAQTAQTTTKDKGYQPGTLRWAISFVAKTVPVGEVNRLLQEGGDKPQGEYFQGQLDEAIKQTIGDANWTAIRDQWKDTLDLKRSLEILGEPNMKWFLALHQQLEKNPQAFKSEIALKALHISARAFKYKINIPELNKEGEGILKKSKEETEAKAKESSKAIATIDGELDTLTKSMRILQERRDKTETEQKETLAKMTQERDKKLHEAGDASFESFTALTKSQRGYYKALDIDSSGYTSDDEDTTDNRITCDKTTYIGLLENSELQEIFYSQNKS